MSLMQLQAVSVTCRVSCVALTADARGGPGSSPKTQRLTPVGGCQQPGGWPHATANACTNADKTADRHLHERIAIRMKSSEARLDGPLQSTGRMYQRAVVPTKARESIQSDSGGSFGSSPKNPKISAVIQTLTKPPRTWDCYNRDSKLSRVYAGKNGAACRNRTDDLPLTRRLLYQLS